MIRLMLVVGIFATITIHTAIAAEEVTIHGVSLDMDLDTAIRSFKGQCSAGFTRNSRLCFDSDDRRTMMTIVLDGIDTLQKASLNFCSDKTTDDVINTLNKRYETSFNSSNDKYSGLKFWQAIVHGIDLQLANDGTCSTGINSYRLLMFRATPDAGAPTPALPKF